MAKHEIYEQRTEKALEPIVSELNVKVYDVEFVKEAGTDILRVTLDKEGGVDIIDCENVSRALSDVLDREDFIPGAYTLEVTSMGLGRPLKKEKDYERNLEKEIEIHLFKAVNKIKEFMGVMTAYDKDTVTILCEGETFTFEKKNISLIREYVNWDEQ